MKKLVCLLLCCLALFSLASCYDYTRIADLLIVLGMGVDYKDDHYIVSVEYLKTSGDSAQSPQSTSVSGKGSSIYEALQDTMSKTSGIKYFNHCQIIIVGEEEANHGLHRFVDILLRNTAFHATAAILVAKGISVQEIFEQASQIQEIMSLELFKSLESEKRELLTSLGLVSNASINNKLSDPYGGLVLPVVTVTEETKAEEEKDIVVDGAALFDGQKLLGFLNRDQIAFYHFVTNQANSGLLSKKDLPEDMAAADEASDDNAQKGENPLPELLDPGSFSQSYSEKRTGLAESPYSTVKIMGNKTHLRPVIENGEIVLNVETFTDVSLLALSFSKNTENHYDISVLENEFARDLEQKIETNTLSVSREFGCDVWGVSLLLRKHSPNKFKSIEAQYKEKIKTMKIHVRSHISIRETGMLTSEKVVKK